MSKPSENGRAALEPTSDLVPIEDATSDVMSGVIWGMEGTGKTLFLLRGAPLPIVVLNLDRPITSALLKQIDVERRSSIFVKNMREKIDDLDVLTGLQIKSGIEETIRRNKKFLRGGTLIIDGGSTFRDVIKIADAKIGPKIEAGQRFNPKDKAQANAYLNAFVSGVVDAGINLFFTAHGAFSWKMSTTEDGKNQLMKSTRVYPKLDDVLLEQTAVSVLLMKRCICGGALTEQDGHCSKATARTVGDHTGRQFIARVVTNKYAPQTEGDEFEDFTFEQLRTLAFGRKKTNGGRGEGVGHRADESAAEESSIDDGPAVDPEEEAPLVHARRKRTT